MTAESLLTSAPARTALVHRIVAEWAERRPGALAVADTTGRRRTYRELDRGADAVAHRLAALGAGPETVVALAFETGVEVVTAMLGVLKAGAAYLPLSLADPRERLEFLLEDAGARFVLADAAGSERLSGTGIPVLELDDDVAGEPFTAPVSGDALAYLIYTSGSTGQPKGVGVTHANLAAYVDQILPVLGAEPGEVFSMVQPVTFDSCLTVLYPALASGGALWLVPPERAADARWLAEHFRDAGVDHVKITPSHLAALHQNGDPAAVMPRRTLLLGGEPSTREWFTGLRSLRPGCAVVNHYGPTETTVGVAALTDPSAARPPGPGTPLGPAMRNASLYVLDEAGVPVADGEAGELCVGGSTVSRGYVGRPAATAAVFVPDPFGDVAGARLYRTGDRVRRRADGTFDFLGRADDQVKVRGFRVEPAEAARALRECDGVVDAVVVPVRDEAGGHRLAGYVRASAGTTSDAVRAEAARRLPAHLVPESVRIVASFPLTRHGKLDRAALPAPEFPAPSPAGPLAGTAGRRVAAIFADLLGRPSVEESESFFDLGGHSLLAAKLISRLRAEFAVEVPVKLVFEAPTPAGIAARLRPEDTGDVLPPVRPASRTEPIPASPGQRRMWFFNQFAPESALYNTNLAVRMLGAVELTVLRDCVSTLVERHEVLRTRLVADGDELVQLIEAAPVLPFEEADLTDCAEDELDDEVRRFVESYSERPFDLTARIPVRVLYLRLAEDEHLLLLSLHHVATDASSMVLLHRELGALYAAKLAGREAGLPPVAAQYADYAAWQREVLAGDAWAGQLEYWRRRLADVPRRLELRTDRPRPVEGGAAGSRVRFAVPDRTVEKLRALGAPAGATLFMVLFAGTLVALRDLTAQEDIAVGVPTAFRPRPELESTVGYFGNLVVLRTDVSGAPTFRELVGRVAETAVSAMANRDLPFEALVEQLAPRRSFAETPWVNVMFALASEEREPVVLDEVTFQAEPVDTATAAADLAVLFQQTAAGCAAEVEYRTDLFDEATVRRFADRLGRVLEAVAAEPERAVTEFADPDVPAVGPAAELLVPAADLDEYVAPATDLEHELCALWAELTGTDDIGTADDFFAVGGHSLMAAQVVQRIRHRHGVTLPLRWCFDQPTVAELALLVLAAQLGGRADGDRILADVEGDDR
ncbi:amino acid adenylation domain-containing protein [Amycolatopsis sp. OK19-0408]|uniref:Amino acid adenylation domain-containing protein n=1 Tax=Amycolatopsis iheyensis TaxID=2945988 RepID=A0A9X2NJ31_9PSEU|nr:amino acid adenylation domain-containing protein [Amycolatopsis iheyensis]MCR6485760.1 amino acid adenylation domain-containing protein [Amycolatopsis iheyensis]